MLGKIVAAAKNMVAGWARSVSAVAVAPSRFASP